MNTEKIQLSNHDAWCIDWYRRLIADGTAEDGQRIAVLMHDEVQRLTDELEKKTRELEISVKLPCNIGDTVYEIFNGKPRPFCVIGFRKGVMMSEYGDCEEIDCEEWCMEYSCGGMSCSTHFSDIGKTVFLTREAAESALSVEGVTE